MEKKKYSICISWSNRPKSNNPNLFESPLQGGVGINSGDETMTVRNFNRTEDWEDSQKKEYVR